MSPGWGRSFTKAPDLRAEGSYFFSWGLKKDRPADENPDILWGKRGEKPYKVSFFVYLFQNGKPQVSSSITYSQKELRLKPSQALPDDIF